MTIKTALRWIAVSIGLAGAQAAYACPQAGSGVQVISGSSSQLYNMVSGSVSAGGGGALRSCNLGPYSGNVPDLAQYALDFSNVDGYALEMRVQGGCDTVMLVNAPDGRWLWDDDSAGNLNPLLRIPSAQSGRYAIWVGTVGGGTCAATLQLETFR